MVNKSRFNYEKYKHKIIEELKGGHQLKELSEKYNIVYSSLSSFIKKDRSIDYNPKLRIQTNYFKIFEKSQDQIIEYLENGNSILNTTKVFKINRVSLKTKLKELGLFKKYSNRNWTPSYVNFQRNEDEIIKMRRDGFSVPDITKKFDVKRQTLKNELIKIKEFEVDVNKRKMYQTEGVKRFQKYESVLIKEFKNGKSLKSLGRKYGIPLITIQKRFIQKGVYEPNERMVHQFNVSFFNKIDEPNKSYWLGWMYSDGFVQIHSISGGKYIGLDLDEKDKNVVEGFRDSLESNMSVKEIIHKPPKNSKWKKNEYKSSRLNFQSEMMFNHLGKLGVVPRKSLILTFPDKNQVPNKLIKPFLLGYFEGDGTIGNRIRKRTDTYRLSMSIVGTLEFCEGYKKHLELIYKEYGIEPIIGLRKEKRSKTNTYTLNVGSTSSILVWFDSLYSSFDSYMDRKKQKIIDYCKWYNQTYIKIGKTPQHMKNVEIIEKIVIKYSNI